MDAFEIKIKRLRSGLKGYELARLVGITPDKMSQFENGRAVPSNDLLARILQVIDQQRTKRITQEDK
ncbi:MAG TPA: helix-turn-helix transcriptional regulator [Desulfitobacteriaceae bacterium]|nr:helix-turn-helix transcriptional regulator [Desulfitobacteriaceae bacterium]